MELYIGNLAAEVTVADLDVLLLGYKPINLAVQEYAAGKGGQTRYARVTVVPDRVAERAINKLHNRKLHGRNIVVRQYMDRKRGNERRHDRLGAQSWSGNNRRRGERRNPQAPA